MCGASAKISVSLAACPEQCLMIRKANVQYGIVCSLYNHWAIINTCTLGSKYISRFLVSFSQRFDWRQMLFHSSGFRSCHFLPRCEIEVRCCYFLQETHSDTCPVAGAKMTQLPGCFICTLHCDAVRVRVDRSASFKCATRQRTILDID